MNDLFHVMHDGVLVLSIRTFTAIILVVFIVVVPIIFFVDLPLLLIVTTRFPACLAWLIVIGVTRGRMNRTWTKIVTARSTTRCWRLRRRSRKSCSTTGHTTRRRIRVGSSLVIAIGQLRQAITNSRITIVQLGSNIGKKLRGWWRAWSTASILIVTMKISTSHGRDIIGRWTRDRRIRSAKQRVAWLEQETVIYLLPLGISVTGRLAATSKHKHTWTGFFLSRRHLLVGWFGIFQYIIDTTIGSGWRHSPGGHRVRSYFCFDEHRSSRYRRCCNRGTRWSCSIRQWDINNIVINNAIRHCLVWFVFNKTNLKKESLTSPLKCFCQCSDIFSCGERAETKSGHIAQRGQEDAQTEKNEMLLVFAGHHCRTSEREGREWTDRHRLAMTTEREREERIE